MPRSTTPDVPFDEPFIVIPVIVPVLVVNPESLVKSETLVGIVAVIAAVLLVIVAAVPLNVTASMPFASPLPVPDILIFPLPSKDSLLIVFILTPDTRVSCLSSVDATYGLKFPSLYQTNSPCVIKFN